MEQHVSYWWYESSVVLGSLLVGIAVWFFGSKLYYSIKYDKLQMQLKEAEFDNPRQLHEALKEMFELISKGWVNCTFKRYRSLWENSFQGYVKNNLKQLKHMSYYLKDRWYVVKHDILGAIELSKMPFYQFALESKDDLDKIIVNKLFEEFISLEPGGMSQNSQIIVLVNELMENQLSKEIALKFRIEDIHGSYKELKADLIELLGRKGEKGKGVGF